jgi:hypothetical protein
MKGSEEQQFIEAYNEHADALFRFAYFKVSEYEIKIRNQKFVFEVY